MSPRRAAAGFTLLEVLVVIVIVGILVSLAVLTLGGRGEARLSEETERLGALLELAREEAVFQARELGLSFWRGGYAFFVMTAGGGWTLLEGDGLLRPRRLPEDIRLSLYVEDLEVSLSLVEKHDAPQVFLFSSGEVTPFTLVLRTEDGPARRLSTDLLGNLHVQVLQAPWD